MTVELFCGDCLDVMATLEAESVDSVITDPPYGLEFMGKEWDRFSGGFSKNEDWAHGNLGGLPRQRKRNIKCPDCDKWIYDHPGRACKCGGVRRAQMQAFEEFNYKWAKEALRVAKPGAMLCAFGGTRTHHRLMCAIEDAGWEIRDVLMWLYGSGFPKSHAIGKAIDKRGGFPHLASEIGNALKAARESRGLTATWCDRVFCGGTTNWSWFEGRPRGQRAPTTETFAKIANAWPEVSHLAEKVAEAEREILGKSDVLLGRKSGIGNSTEGHHTVGGTVAQAYDITSPATDAAALWDGYGTALKPAYEPIILAMKPLPGTFAQNALEYGVAGLWVDGCRVASSDIVGASGRWGFKEEMGWNSNNVPSQTQNTFEHTNGRWPANLLLSHAPGCECVGVRKVKGAGWRDKDGAGEPQPDMYGGYAERKRQGHTSPDGTETVEAWNCVPECPVFLLDQSSGERHSSCGGGNRRNGDSLFHTGKDGGQSEQYYDKGGASRFFTRFHYSAKASRSERELGLLGHIPCLKCGELDSVTHMNTKTGKEEKCRRNGHPTVKPLDVCRWLCRLTKTPTGGVVLDPFMGSGRISMAAILEGRDTIGIELERPSFEIAQAAVQWAQEQMPEMIQARMVV